MIEVELIQFSLNNFKIVTDDRIYYTSAQISSLFNMNIENYNRILVEKVIQHGLFKVHNNSKGHFKRNISFSQNRTSDETYIKRFKNAFAEQLILLTLGGVK